MVVKGYPRLSETFIAQEILALQRRGLRMTVVSLRHPTDKRTHPIHAEIRAPLLYLPEEKKWVSLRVSTNGMRTINKIGLAEALKRAKAKGYYKD